MLNGVTFNYKKGIFMTQRLEMYKCDVCGNILQVLVEGKGNPACCGQDMILLVPHTLEDEKLSEKHVPVFVTTGDDGSEIKIGSVPHPMIAEHYIMFVEAISADKSKLKLQYLQPGDEPKMVINHKFNGSARAYCNIHGLWTADKEQ
jgi:superoxide reductase